MVSYRRTGQRTFWLALFLLLVISLFWVWTQASAAQTTPTASLGAMPAAIDPPLAYAPGVVIVKVKPGVRLATKPGIVTGNALVSANNSDLAPVLQASGVRGAESLFTAGGAETARVAGVDNPLARIYRLHLAADANVSTAVELLRTSAAVEYAEPDYLAQAALIPNDPMWGNQWALSKINAPAAWDVTQGAATTIIALIDSGIDPAHPDLVGKLWQNDDIAGNGIDDDQNGKIDDSNGWNFVTEANNVADLNGHGTQVAGVAGASTNNGLGVAGLCWHCPLMPVVAMQANGVANYSTIANAVVYAAANGASVINLSLGGYADSSLLREAIREAATTAVIVAAAGNDDSVTPFYPAAYPEVIAVAATGATDQKAIFSNYGPWVDLAAPGELIQTTTISDYTASSGTSVATPLVAGVAGLLKSHHPDWSPALITWQLLNTGAPVDGMNPTYAGQLGHGRLDAGAALTQPPQARVQVTGYTVDGQSNGRPTPGQSFPLALTLRNIWMPAQSLVGSVTTTDPYVTIGDPQGVFGDIGPGATGQNNSDPFVVTLQPNTPYNRVLPLTLTLTGANGYTTTAPFTLQVRTAVETLGNTQYTQNTTWTSDKTYVLNGAVIVGQGITLTIQPGAVIKANSGKFIRVDGTLIARGTQQNPIVFTTNATNYDSWNGLSFTDTAISASFDTNNNYVGGSILQHVEISYANLGVSLSTRTPYIADSLFHKNGNGIRKNDGDSAFFKIEHNTFSENTIAVSMSGGHPFIAHNTFTRNTNFVTASGIAGSGSPQIVDNIFIDERGAAVINLEGTPTVRRNRIIDSSGGVTLRNLQAVDVENNVIVNNRPYCLASPCSTTGWPVLWIDVQGSAGPGVQNNTIINNRTYGLQLSGPGASSVQVAYNNLFNNQTYDLYLDRSLPNVMVNATNNFWHVDASAIAGRIHDCTFDENGCGSPSSTLGKAQYDPPLTEPSQNAPAFVRRTTMNPDPVGLNQSGIMTIDFSRPMLTETMPLVSFHDARRGTQEVMGAVANVMAKDAVGRMWFGGGKGALMFDGRKWYTYTMSNSGIASNQIDTIYGAANGDVWFANVFPSVPHHLAPLSRLRGPTWLTYTNFGEISLGSIRVIGEDGLAGLWLADGQPGVVHFDGGNGRRYTTADGLGYNRVTAITNDKNGNSWFIVDDNGSAERSGITRFDGTTWQTYRTGTDLPSPANLGPIFADSQGRVWVSVQDAMAATQGGKPVGMFSNNAWTFFGSAETSGLVGCGAYAFTETPAGDIQIALCDRVVTFKEGVWATTNRSSTVGSAVLFDAYNHLWSSSNGLRILWHGLDYPFDAGQWLSPTRYQSSYNFTALIPQGIYAVSVSGAIGTDGMEAVPDAADTFRVDFGIAANPVPPFAPAITAENNGTLTTITAHWRTDSPDVDHYRYAIGTTPGARNVVGWTYLTTNRMMRTDLALIQGQPYYVSVQARNKFGLWSASGVSNQVIGGVVTTLPTPTTPPPGGPTATPAGETPTPTPTPLGGTPVLTPTMTMTPIPSQSLNAIGETSGAPGSRFIFTGSGFSPNTELPVVVTPQDAAVAAGPLVMVGVVTTDANGNFTLTLQTDATLPAGRYQLTVGATQQAISAFEINPTAPLRQPTVIGVFITTAKQLYLPLVSRQ
ncbi:MAG: hypothetical protein DYG89_23100 [Caldilinea sp. CFX5]|nr:hypothetical protein [Caldilinea sp. CFX5]